MTEKDLVSKLNKLQATKPDQAWMASNRELFLSQISNSGADKLSAWKLFVINFKSFSQASSQPVFALGIFLVVLVSSTVFSHKLFSQAKPNDSLYIARIISEKVKLNTVFNSEARDKMEAQFAADHAKDISAVLADPNFNKEENQDQIAKLNDSFNKEIDTVKSKMNNLAARKAQDKAETATEDKQPAAEQAEESVSIASGEIADQGIQIAAKSLAATSTAAATSTKAEAASSSDQIIDDAKKSFDKKQYEDVINKLKEVDEIIK